MTKREASLGDNGGRCESCNTEESASMSQTTVKVYCGGGLGWSDMWVCPPCKIKHEEREAERKKKREAEQPRLDALRNKRMAAKAHVEFLQKQIIQTAEKLAVANREFSLLDEELKELIGAFDEDR